MDNLLAKTKSYFAPGRVNLIGEHIDYCGGHVLPAAISLGITAEVSFNDNNQIHFSSEGIDQKVSVNISDAIDYNKENDWANYPIGVLDFYLKKQLKPSGMNIHFTSNLPQGSGLSSSAAIECLMAFILQNNFGDPNYSKRQLALDCQEVEQNFIGVNCGIMDQYAIANGLAGAALLLDCETVSHQAINFENEDLTFLIINSKKERSLNESKYNERVAACSEALAIIRKQKALKNLSSAAMSDINFIDDPVIKQRASHVISENIRVKKFAAALESNQFNLMGLLLNQSHYSLKHNYEVTGEHLDCIVTTATNQNDCYGARMTGAGFGGCCIALVEIGAVESISQAVKSAYSQKFGFEPEVYPVKFSEGVKVC